MKVLLAQPATPRFQWELEVLLCNLRKFTDSKVVLLFTEHDFVVPIEFRRKYPECEVHTYIDKREDLKYLPSIRPYLLWRYLSEDPAREQETYFYIDSDVIFREWIDFTKLEAGPKKIIGSDCSSYLSYDYILSCEKGPAIAAQMASICGITVDQMKGVPGIGAHLLLTNPRADFWLRVYQDSVSIYNYYGVLTTNIQRWTAEMWAQLWGWVREGYELVASPELDFCRPTDSIEKWSEVKILHNAGVTGDSEMFFKGKYSDKMPFGENFDYVRRDLCSIKYVNAVESVVR